METVKDHYDRFLGSVYSWILGDFDNARQKNAALFDTLEVSPGGNAVAVDLGCGPGCQSLPLADLGFDVLAIDFCRELVDELKSRSAGLSIRPVHDDLANFRSHMSDPAELIVCMGDTLVHLPDTATVNRVIDDVCASLQPGGRFIYSIRDYVSFVPEGADRFVPVRADDDRVFTCFLDYGDDAVHVHDILHRKVDGAWTTEISDYRKLRLDPDRINERLAAGGLKVASGSLLDGMIVVIAEAAE